MQACLGGAVGCVLGVRSKSLNRADVNDCAPALKVGQGVLDHEKRCREIDIECSVPVSQGRVFDRVFQHDPGIVDERVQTAVVIDNLLDNAFRCVGVRKVCFNAMKGVSRSTLCRDHFVARLRELLRTGKTNPASTPGNQRDLVHASVDGFAAVNLNQTAAHIACLV